MRYRLIPLVLTLLLSGCSVLRGGKLWAPETFGLQPVAPNLYVERGMDAATIAQLKEAMLKAEAAIRATYGGVLSQPLVHACFTDACLAAFGGEGTFAKVYGKRILLSRNGLNWHFIAHEWSHAELWQRLGFTAWKRMPQWFDDGVAVAVSEAPQHTELHWDYLVAHNIARPSREELMGLKTLDAWLAAQRRYSDNKNAERRARGETEIHALYAAAGHEVRPWLVKVGVPGMLVLIDKLNDGATFTEVYPVATF